MADPEYLGEVVAATAGPAQRLLEAVAAAGPEEVPGLMEVASRQAPGLAAALACYVGTCAPPTRSEARGR